MVLPNFICLGVGKAGTTSLHYLLQQHPDVLLVPEKEANFFNSEDNYAKGLEWYGEKFSRHSGQRFVGDITPSYFFSPASFERIASVCGLEVKLILIFRQPTARAYSHYLHHVRLFETNQSFSHDLEGDDLLLRTASTYAERFRMLLDIFPRRNVLPLIYERHIAKGNLPMGYIKIAKFLGLGVHPINFNVHMGKAHIPLVRSIQTVEDAKSFPQFDNIALGDIVVETIRNSEADLLPELISAPSAEVVQWYADFETNITRSLSVEESRDITERLFAEDVAAMREMLGDALPEWGL